MQRILSILMSLFLSASCYASSNLSADVAPISIPSSSLMEFQTLTPKVKMLIEKGLSLTRKNLTYTYASADPQNGGMDCSGTIYYLLQSMNVKDIPRGTDVMYEWIVKHGNFHSVSDSSFDSPQFNALRPGDLLFWTGTWETKRSSPISHVMLYLGKDKEGNHVMFGSSDGRTYKGKKIWGVSVFDFKLPPKESKAKFIGYSCIPTINC